MSNMQTVNGNSCIVCTGSFGVQDQRAPHKCNKENCGRNYCTQCLDNIKIFNGPDRPFRCMFCLLKYPMDTVPVENEPLIEQLWERVNIKYGFRQRGASACVMMSRRDLQFELECRQYHMKHLLTRLERFADWNRVTNALIARNFAFDMVNQLANILSQVKDNTTADDPLWQSEYNRIITIPNHSVGSFYVDLCERLSAEIVDAELRCMFPATHAKSIEWNYAVGTGDEFQPKISELMDAIQHDVNSISSNSYHATLRTKIGFIGYTSSGKTTLMCRLLGIVGSSERGQFLPVHTTKSTYYPLQYDRDRPLINPNDQRIATAVQFVDIQGCDRGSNISSGVIEAGNYLDEIRKVDCDIYVIVFNEELANDQYQWIVFIEQLMKRQCVLVRSKVDLSFLDKFLENSGVYYGTSSVEERNTWSKATIDDLRRDFTVEGHHVYLTAASYRPANSDAAVLLQNQSFDFQPLLHELGRLAPLTRNLRVHSLAVRAVGRVINSCFRCGYVLNVMKYKIAAGIAAVIPYGDLLPRYLARGSIQQAFGITEDFLEDLNRRQLQVMDGQLQTSVFKKHVKVLPTLQLSNGVPTTAGGMTLGVAAVCGLLVDDIARAAIPTLSALTTGARIALSVATLGIGVVISAGVCAWVAVSTGKHIFSYVNRLCDDLIVVSIPLIESMIQERPTVSTI